MAMSKRERKYGPSKKTVSEKVNAPAVRRESELRTHGFSASLGGHTSNYRSGAFRHAK